MMLNREDYPDLTDEEFDKISWQSYDGVCDGCGKVGIKCYNILRAGLHKLNGDAVLEKLRDGLDFYWNKDIREILKSSDAAIRYVSTSGHFCMQCANNRVELEREHMIDNFGHYIKDENITFCLTEIRDGILMLHVE